MRSEFEQLELDEFVHIFPNVSTDLLQWPIESIRDLVRYLFDVVPAVTQSPNDGANIVELVCVVPFDKNRASVDVPKADIEYLGRPRRVCHAAPPSRTSERRSGPIAESAPPPGQMSTGAVRMSIFRMVGFLYMSQFTSFHSVLIHDSLWLLDLSKIICGARDA